MKRKSRLIADSPVVRVAVAVAVAGMVAGCAGAPPPDFDGYIIEHQQGTVHKYEGVSFGLMSVWEDDVRIEAWETHGDTSQQDVVFELKIGEASEFKGVHIRLCGVWVDTSVNPFSPPGSDASMAYYVVGTEDSAPECPARTN